MSTSAVKRDIQKKFGETKPKTTTYADLATKRSKALDKIRSIKKTLPKSTRATVDLAKPLAQVKTTGARAFYKPAIKSVPKTFRPLARPAVKNVSKLRGLMRGTSGRTKAVVATASAVASIPLVQRLLKPKNIAKTGSVVAGGEAPLRANTELWNGSSWTEVNDLNTAAQAGRMCGTSTASLYAGGSRPGNSTLTEQWDGTNWTEVGDLGTTRNKQAQGGSTTAAVVGFGAIPAITATAEEWEFPPVTSTIQQEGQLYFKGGALKGFEKAGGIPAATWSSGGTMNTARQYGGAFGSQTAGLVAGGETSTAVNNVEQYDGTSWTEITEINTTRYGLEGFGDSYTSGFVVGGAPNKTETESWNGTAWTEVNDLPQGTERGGCAGTSTSAFYVGGYKYPSPAQPTNVGYDWDGSSWGTGNNLNQPRDRMGAAGVITSGIVFGGTSGPPYTERNETELYDGSSWTETGNLNTTRRELGASAFNRTNGLVLGFGSEPPATANTEIFNGSSWTEVNNLSTARAAGGGLGTSIAAAFAGGSGVTGATEHFTADITNTTITSS